jgi:virginiamycin B lyase
VIDAQASRHVLCMSMVGARSCRRARNWAALAGEAAGWRLAIAIGLAGVLAGDQALAGQAAPTNPPPVRVADRIPLARLTPDAVVPIPAGPGTAVTADGLWVPATSEPVVRRVDATSNLVTVEARLEAVPCASLAAAFDAVWVPRCDAKTIARIDPAKGTPTASVAVTAAAAGGQIAVAVGSVWVAFDSTGVVARIDPATNAAVAEVYVAGHPVAVSGSDDGLWISSEDGDVVSRVDPHTNAVVETIKAGPRPGRIARGEGGVWVLNRGDGSVTRIDPATNTVVAMIAVDAAVGDGEIAAGEGSVWISAPGVPLIRIDPRANRAVQRFEGTGGGAVAIGHGSIWVSAGAKALWRLDPLLVVATRP